MSDTINVAIVDDESIQVDLLQQYVESYGANKNYKIIIEKFYSAESFDFKWSMDKKYDVILLDIQMPGLNGIELAKNIRKKDSTVSIIFITAITDYIGDGYDVSAVNYLIKPIKKEKLFECLDKALFNSLKESKSMLIDVNGEIQKIYEKDIMYIEAFAHEVEVTTIRGKLLIKKSIGQIEKELCEDDFIKCHRSYIAGLRFVKRISNNELELDNGKVIPVSRRLYAKTNMAFIKYYRGK